MLKRISIVLTSIVCSLLCVTVSFALFTKASADVKLQIGGGDVVYENDRTLYFATGDWDRCYFYAWDDDGANNTYPGIEMVKMGKNELDQYIFKTDTLSKYTKMIFSNGGQNASDKTADLNVSDFDFSGGDLLFWKDDSLAAKAGTVLFDDSYITSYADNMATNPGPILQAWGWRTSDVKARIADIAAAGYKAVQLSPMQPVGGGSSTSDAWYMLYQPLGFSVATSGQNPIGDKNSLMELTAAADAVGVDIMVDVIANHLAAGDSCQLYSGVRYFEQYIYDNHLIHNAGKIGDGDDGNTYKIVRGNLGDLPDLQTENTFIQNRVISMLKEYIDCGVKGFRFDAAKHIETPKDGDFASDFWPNVIGSINSYGLETYGKAPYSYGEILGVGTYRDWSGYTSYIDVTDNNVSTDTRNKILASDEGGVVNAGYYSINASGDYAVLFGETHDTFTDGGTSGIYGPSINMTYGFHISRAGASTFYFARPQASEQHGKETGIVIYTPMGDYKNSIISAANKLHNDFVGGSEYLSAYDGCAINARVLNDKIGVYICDPDFGSEKTVRVPISGGYIPNGTYTNLINNSTVTVNDGYVTVGLTEGVAVLEYDPSEIASNMSATKNGVELDLSEYAQDSGSDKLVLTIPNLAVNDVIAIYENDTAIQVYGVNGAAVSHTDSYTVTTAGSHTFYVNTSNEIWVLAPVPQDVATTVNCWPKINIPNGDVDRVYAWVWTNDNDGQWYYATHISETWEGEWNRHYTVSIVNPVGKKILLACFNSSSGVDATHPPTSWDNKVSQTSDATIDNNLSVF